MIDQSTVPLSQLSALPNLSFTLCERLTEVGVDTPARLRDLGAEAVWQRLHHHRSIPSIQLLLALEGAIQECSWRDLPAPRRIELVRFASSVSNEYSEVATN